MGKIIESISNQTIHPYTDMLLHDMGDDLADNRPDFEADGNEWAYTTIMGYRFDKKQFTIIPSFYMMDEHVI